MKVNSNVDVITQGDGSYVINAANGATLVNGVDANSLALGDGRVMWQGSGGSSRDITDDISGGKLSGWLDIRDEVLPTYKAQVNELAWVSGIEASQRGDQTLWEVSVTDEAAAERLREEGRAWSIEEAVAYALDTD